MKKEGIFLFIFMFLLINISLISAELPNLIDGNQNLPELINPNSFIGNFDFNGLCSNGGVEIRSDGTICGQRLEVFNITSVNIEEQNVTVLENFIIEGDILLENIITFFLGEMIDNLIDNWIRITGNLNVTGNISLEFGDLISEQNPDGANAIRLKGTSSDVDIVLGHGTGYFSVWNTADDTNVFNVNDRGNTIIAGDLTVDTNTLFVDSGNDKVGIGRITPDSAFHIKAGISGTVGSHSAGQIIIQNPTDSVFSNAVITGYESDGSGNPDQQLWYLGSSSGSNSNIIFLNRRNALLQFGTNDNTRMTILGNGNVGIGIVSSLLAKLHVLGNVFFDGDLNVTGNITSANVFIPQYIFSHTNETIGLDTVNVWKNITFQQEATDIKFGILHTHNDNSNQTFTINIAGIYNLEYDFDVVDTSPSASDIDVSGRIIYKNGTEIVGSAFEIDITKQQIETELSHSTLARLNAGDQIIFQFIANDVDVAISTHGTFGDHPDSATIIIEKIANL